MKDHMIQGTAFGGEVRYYAAYTRDTVEEARRIHHTSPVCTAALGRLLTSGAIMGAMAKGEEDTLTLRIDGDGPIGRITVTADTHGHVKGLCAHSDVTLPLKADHHLDVGGAVGHGTLSVIRDLGLREPYIGQTALVSGEIAEDITYYFAESEQTPTVVGLGVLVDTDSSVRHAGGFLLQLLPYATEETISYLEERVAQIRYVTDYYSEGHSPESMLRAFLGDTVSDAGVDAASAETQGTLPSPILQPPLYTRPISYRCDCDRERVTRALLSLGRGELESMITEGEPVSLHCDFCGKDYAFTPEEIQALLT